MQLIRCLLSHFYLNMFRASLCPSSGEQGLVLLHMVFCAGCAGCVVCSWVVGCVKVSVRLRASRTETRTYKEINKYSLRHHLAQCRRCREQDTVKHRPLTQTFNPSAWSDGHCPHTVNITCRGVTGTARIQ